MTGEGLDDAAEFVIKIEVEVMRDEGTWTSVALLPTSLTLLSVDLERDGTLVGSKSNVASERVTSLKESPQYEGA